MSFENEHLGIKLTHFLCVDLIKKRPVKFLKNLIFFQYFVVQIIQTYYFLKIFEIRFFVKYAPVYFGTYFLLFVIIVSWFSENIDNYTTAQFDKWELENMTQTFDEKLYKKIKTPSMIVSIVIITNFALALVSGYFHILPDDDDKEIFFIFIFVEEHFPKWQSVISWAIRSTYIFTAYFMIYPINTLSYFMWRLKFHMYFYLENIKKINEGRPQNEKNITTCIPFQKEVRKRLIRCIKRHTEIAHLYTLTNGIFGTMILVCAVLGGLLMVSTAFFVLAFEGSFFKKIWRVGTLILCAAITSAGSTHSGESLETSGNNIFLYLKEQDWYIWDRENQKIYLIFLTNVKPLRIEFSADVGINYKLAVSTLRTVYSIVSVLSQLIK
ncbi:odorant receptor 301 [Tribolium castaneum]|uniref:Odorant receptor n=1 Tax=Tribolium castaneum TaxID=7070 RepID=D2A0Y8_TRICA|nr:odorant receptor 301 [Tribolium castaneum]